MKQGGASWVAAEHNTNNKPFMGRPTLIDLNLAEFNYCPDRISLDECSGTHNAADALPTKIFVSVK